ncbi:uncharacterized protein LOC130216083 [Danio aesculapii]|uniref:uncharacterized protein LOC130216083 n=1 Tax=Danio aesculapii TaxID=1142201 RepID=UPI0024BF1480|nr:uncharacterized protein LOC130216083 [Danio aesculapii]
MAAPFIGGYQSKTNNFIVVVFAVFAFLVHGVSEDDPTGTSLVAGDSVTLHTGVETNQQNKIKWYFNNTLIAQIIVNPSQICTDVRCNNSIESFRNRLKLDNQTGSLTIMNIRNTDAGGYKLRIFSSSRPRENVFKVSVNDDYTAKEKRKFVKRGESVTLDTHIQIKTTDVIKWHFNDHPIAGINGQESFREGLRLDNQTGSLTIMNTTDSGDYYVKIIISRTNNFNVTILKNFSVNVTALSGLSSLFKAILPYFMLPAAAAAAIGATTVGVIYHRRVSSKKNEKKNMTKILHAATEKVVLQMEKQPNPADRRGSGFNGPISQNKQKYIF